MKNALLFHEITFHEPRGDYLVFYGWPKPSGPWRLRERYARYACDRCGKFDPRDAVKAGFDPEILTKPPKVDAFSTRDLQYVVSDRGLAALKECMGERLKSWRIGNTPWSLTMPATLILPDSRADSHGFVSPAFKAYGMRCKVCGRWDELALHRTRVEVKSRQRLVGYWVEADHLGCPNLAWVCDDEMRDTISRNKILGVKIDRDEFGPTSRKAIQFDSLLNDPA